MGMTRLIVAALALLCAASVGRPKVAKAEAAAQYRLLTINGRIVKWGGASLGEGASLTYAFVRKETSFPDARNCKKLEPVETLLSEMEIDKPAFEGVVERSFAAWSAAADVEFKRIEDIQTADILIGGDGEARGWAFADVHTSTHEGAVGRIDRALVCLNAARDWKVGFGGRADAQDIGFTLTHEIGHALGLNHPGPHGQLMSFTYGESFAGLQAGDVEGAQALYGPAAPRAAPLLAAGAR